MVRFCVSFFRIFCFFCFLCLSSRNYNFTTLLFLIMRTCTRQGSIQNRYSDSQQSLEEIMLGKRHEEILSNIQVMRLQEENTYACNRDYLFDMQHQMEIIDDSRQRHQKKTKFLSCTSSHPVDKECRFKMAEWSYQVIDSCRFKRETVAIAMSYLDRYLLTDEGSRLVLQSRKKFQLASLVVLYIAVKLNESKAMEASVLTTVSRGMYTESEVHTMELSILQALQWRVNPPTSLSFVRLFLELAVPASAIENEDIRKIIFEHAKFQTELAVNEYDFVGVKPSSIAFAAISNAFSGTDSKDFPRDKQQECLQIIANAASIHTSAKSRKNIDNSNGIHNVDEHIIYDPPLQDLRLAMEALSKITCKSLASLGCPTTGSPSSYFAMSPRTTVLLNKTKTMGKDDEEVSCFQGSPRSVTDDVGNN